VRRGLARIDYGGNGAPLTMSFGVASLERDEAMETLRRRADDALYRAKRDGRNNVVVAEGRSESRS
jgi:PleD family two-component response regulator